MEGAAQSPKAVIALTRLNTSSGQLFQQIIKEMLFKKRDMHAPSFGGIRRAKGSRRCVRTLAPPGRGSFPDTNRGSHRFRGLRRRFDIAKFST